MSEKPHTTPPERVRSINYISDAQKTPTGPRSAGPLAGSSGKDDNVTNRWGPYKTPTPEQHRTRSRAPSPTLSNHQCTSRSAFVEPTKELVWMEGARGMEDDEDNEDDEIENNGSPPLSLPTNDPEDPIASNTTPAPSNKAQWKFARL